MWNADIEQFDLMLDTSYWRGYWGNFASSVPADSGIGDWCMTYKQKSKLPKNGDAPEKKPLKIKEQNQKAEQYHIMNFFYVCFTFAR